MKKGFASMTIVYSFLLVFLLTLVSLLALYTEKSRYVDSIVSEGKEELGSVTSVSAYQKLVFSGWTQSFLIDSRGKLYSWGDNTYGQLGINSVVTRSLVPANVTNWLGTDFIKIASGQNHALGLDESGALWSWGYNSNGQLGDTTTTTRTAPVKITNADLTNFVNIATGANHSLAIDTSGNLWTWGYNNYYQLGNNSTTQSPTPIKIINGDSTDFVKIAAGYYHSLGIDTAGHLWVWGYDAYYQLGNNSTTSVKIPTKITNSDGTNFVDVVAGEQYSMAIDTAGHLWVWGYNNTGQLGNNSTSTQPVPIKITNTDGTNFVKIYANGATSAGIDTNGTLWMWGYNGYGQLGNNSTTQSNIPIKVTNPEGADFVTVSLGRYYTMAVDTNGNVLRWGYNNVGQLGNNTTTQSLVPIKPVLNKPNKIKAMASTSVTVDKLGNSWGWGYNSLGQIGDTSSTSRNIPVKITNTDGTKFVEIYAGNSSNHVMAIDEVGNFWAWGYNNYGQLGNNTQTNSLFPIKITNTDGTKFVKADTGLYHTLAIDEVGNLWTWGYNNYSQLGNGSTTLSKIPIKIINSDGTKFVSVSAGGYHSLAIDENGNLWTWGYNNNGQLGNNTQTNSSIPIKITNTDGTKWSSVDAGYYHSIAIDENGSLWTWGYNAYSQLGNGSTTLSKIPIKITNSDATNLVSISAGDNFNLAIDVNNNTWVWGYNNYGQLGDTTTTTRNIPVKITNSAGTKFSSVSAGGSHSLAIDELGNLWTWGYNNYSQLGNGLSTQLPYPIRIALIQ